MPNELQVVNGGAVTQEYAPMPAIMEQVLMAGDLAKLTPPQRVAFYASVCQSVGLNPLTRPFEYISLNGKLVLYATKNCTDQLRYVHGISVDRLSREVVDGILVTTAGVSNARGRKDEDIGAVSVEGLKGEARANALMKSTTKAKRRATLSICGLSMPDESEIESIPQARRVPVDVSTGELIEQARQIDTGGQKIGTQAAADAVAKRKLAEMQSVKQQVQQAEPAKSKNYEVLAKFREIKRELGDEDYYIILGNSGFQHADEITDVEQARKVYREMAGYVKAKREHAAKHAAQPAAAMAEAADEVWPEGRE